MKQEDEKKEKDKQNRLSASGTTKTTQDSLSDTFNDCNKIKKRFKRLDLNS